MAGFEYGSGANTEIQRMFAQMVAGNAPKPATGAGATTFGTPGTLTGSPPRGYTTASGGIPGVPSPQATQTTAIGGNVAALPALTGLAGGVNQFNLGEVLKQYQAGIPGYNAMAAKSSGNIADALAGRIPGDVINMLGQRAAERGVQAGMPGSPSANAAYLRALGLTSLDQQRYGEQALTGAVGRMPRAGIYDLARDFVTPQQQEELEYMANVLAAAPIPQEQYNQALMAARMGMNLGYGASRQQPGIWNPYGAGTQTAPGQTSPAGSIMAKYQPAPSGGAPQTYQPEYDYASGLWPTNSAYSLGQPGYEQVSNTQLVEQSGQGTGENDPLVLAYLQAKFQEPDYDWQNDYYDYFDQGGN